MKEGALGELYSYVIKWVSLTKHKYGVGVNSSIKEF